MTEQRLIEAYALLQKAIEEKRIVLQMEDLVRREVIIQTAYKDLVDFINSDPTIDAVPVVRCGECARRYTELCALYAGQMNVKKYFVYKEDDFFCGKGERLNDKFDGAKTITVPKWRGDTT